MVLRGGRKSYVGIENVTGRTDKRRALGGLRALVSISDGPAGAPEGVSLHGNDKQRRRRRGDGTEVQTQSASRSCTSSLHNSGPARMGKPLSVVLRSSQYLVATSNPIFPEASRRKFFFQQARRHRLALDGCGPSGAPSVSSRGDALARRPGASRYISLASSAMKVWSYFLISQMKA
jgi:hypothetical protein